MADAKVERGDDGWIWGVWRRGQRGEAVRSQAPVDLLTTAKAQAEAAMLALLSAHQRAAWRRARSAGPPTDGETPE